MYIFDLNYSYSHKVVTETEKVGRIMEGTLCAEDYTFIWKNKLLFKDRIFYNHSTIIAVKRVHIVIDRVSHILMRDCR